MNQALLTLSYCRLHRQAIATTSSIVAVVFFLVASSTCLPHLKMSYPFCVGVVVGGGVDPQSFEGGGVAGVLPLPDPLLGVPVFVFLSPFEFAPLVGATSASATVQSEFIVTPGSTVAIPSSEFVSIFTTLTFAFAY
jgi:hypothetical protein